MARPTRLSHHTWPEALVLLLCLAGCQKPSADGRSDGAADTSKPLTDARTSTATAGDTAAKPRVDGRPLDTSKPGEVAVADASKPLADARTSTVPGEDAAMATVDGAAALDASMPVLNTCSKPADCAVAGACPADALAGCTCVALPEGKTCLARCSANRDCPKSSATELACSAAGLCIPKAQISIDPGTIRPRPDASRGNDADDDDAGERDAPRKTGDSGHVD